MHLKSHRKKTQRSGTIGESREEISVEELPDGIVCKSCTNGDDRAKHSQEWVQITWIVSFEYTIFYEATTHKLKAQAILINIFHTCSFGLFKKRYTETHNTSNGIVQKNNVTANEQIASAQKDAVRISKISHISLH